MTPVGPGLDRPLRMQRVPRVQPRARPPGRPGQALARTPPSACGRRAPAFSNVAAACPAVAARANRQGDAATAEMRTAEAALSHQGDASRALDKALDLDLRATMARGEKGDPAQIEQLLGEAEKSWRDAVDVCQSPHREKAEKSLAATVKARAANAELLERRPGLRQRLEERRIPR